MVNSNCPLNSLPQTYLLFNEISFHNITNSESDQVQMFQQPQLQQQPTFFINEDPDIDQIRIRSPPAIIQLDD